MKKITMLSVVLIMLAALIVFGGVAKAEANDHSDTALAFLKEAENDVAASEVLPELTEFSELSGKTVSMLTGATTGSVQIQQLEERFPNAELFYFTSSVDLLNALRANKIDAYAEPEPIVKYMMLENPDLTYLDERLGDGMQMDLTQSDDELGLTVLKGMAEGMDYSWNETEPLPNSLHIKIR